MVNYSVGNVPRETPGHQPSSLSKKVISSISFPFLSSSNVQTEQIKIYLKYLFNIGRNILSHWILLCSVISFSQTGCPGLLHCLVDFGLKSKHEVKYLKRKVNEYLCVWMKTGNWSRSLWLLGHLLHPQGRNGCWPNSDGSFAGARNDSLWQHTNTQMKNTKWLLR